jgi:hypothetical protein
LRSSLLARHVTISGSYGGGFAVCRLGEDLLDKDDGSCNAALPGYLESDVKVLLAPGYDLVC